MGRKYIDCREHPSNVKCSLAITADTEEEVVEAAFQHAVSVHGYPNSADVRESLRKEIKEGAPRM